MVYIWQFLYYHVVQRANMFIARHGNIETTIYIPLVIHTVHSLVQAQARVQLRWKTLHLIGGIPSSYTLFFYTSGTWYTPSRIPQDTQDCGEYNCYNTSGTTTNSDVSVVIFIEVTTMSWELNMIIWKQSVLWSLRSIRTRVWPWSNKRWQTGSTRRGDASYITPFHTFWQTRSHGV